MTDNFHLHATTSRADTFTGQIGGDGVIYKYDYLTQKNIPIGVDKATFNSMVDDKDKYYKLGVEKGYIKTPEQIEEEKRVEIEKKEIEELEFKKEMLNTIKLLKKEIEDLKGDVDYGCEENVTNITDVIPTAE